MSYSLPTNDIINSSNGLISILMYVDYATFGWFSRMLLIGLYIIIVMGYYKVKEDIIGGIAIAGFSTFVIAFLFYIVGFFQGLELAFSFGVMVIGVAWILLDKQGTA